MLNLFFFYGLKIVLVNYPKSIAANCDYCFNYQPGITCWNSTVETPEVCVKCQKNVWNLFKVNNKDNKTTSMTLVLTLNRFYTLLGCFHCWLFWTSKYRLANIPSLVTSRSPSTLTVSSRFLRMSQNDH